MGRPPYWMQAQEMKKWNDCARCAELQIALLLENRTAMNWKLAAH